MNSLSLRWLWPILPHSSGCVRSTMSNRGRERERERERERDVGISYSLGIDVALADKCLSPEPRQSFQSFSHSRGSRGTDMLFTDPSCYLFFSHSIPIFFLLVSSEISLTRSTPRDGGWKATVSSSLPLCLLSRFPWQLTIPWTFFHCFLSTRRMRRETSLRRSNKNLSPFEYASETRFRAFSKRLYSGWRVCSGAR